MLTDVSDLFSHNFINSGIDVKAALSPLGMRKKSEPMVMKVITKVTRYELRVLLSVISNWRLDASRGDWRLSNWNIIHVIKIPSKPSQMEGPLSKARAAVMLARV